MEEYDYLFKILVIGDPGTGKSSLLNRFADDIFSERYSITVGFDFKLRTLAVDGKLIKLQLWDTAGQEIFRTITSTYYRGAHGVILVYDVTRQETFKNLEYWLQEINKYACDNIVKILVGNKIDKAVEKTIGYQMARDYATQKSMPFIETSAKTALNVDEVFATMAVMIRNNVTSIQELEDFPNKDTISLEYIATNENSWTLGYCC